MKNIVASLLVLASMTSLGQNFTIENENGNVVYFDESQRIKIKVEGYDSTKIIAAANLLGVLKGENGNYIVSLTARNFGQRNIGDSLSISVLVEKENSKYLIGSKSFLIARKNDFSIGLDLFRSGDRVSDQQFAESQQLTVLINNKVALADENGFSIFGYNCLLVPENGNPSAYLISEPNISAQIKKDFLEMKDGGRILFDDIILKDKNGQQKLGSPFYLIKNVKKGYFLYPFSEKNTYTIDELLNVGPLSVQKFSGPDQPNQVFKVTNFNIMVLPTYGSDEVYEQLGDQFSDINKSMLRSKLKAGDVVLFTGPIFIGPDGTSKICNSISITIRD